MSLLVVLLPAIFLSQQVGLFNTDISQLNPASIASKNFLVVVVFLGFLLKPLLNFYPMPNLMITATN
jgi:hypothetical protein